MRLEAAVVRARPQLRRAMQAWQSNRQQCLEEAKACHESALKFEVWRESLFGTTFRFPNDPTRHLRHAARACTPPSTTKFRATMLCHTRTIGRL